MQFIFFFFPGTMLFLSQTFRKREMNEVLTYSSFLSIAFYVVIAAFTWLIPLPLAFLTYFSIVSSFILLIAYRRKAGKMTLTPNDRIVILVFIAVLAMRMVPMFFLTVPSDNGMAAITSASRAIYEADSIPRNISVAPGFPSLIAMLTLAGGPRLYGGSLLLCCISYFLLTPAIYLLLLKFFNARVALFASVVASSAAFGSAADILSLSLLLASVALILVPGRPDTLKRLIAVFILCSAFLISFMFLDSTALIAIAAAFAIAKYFSGRSDFRFPSASICILSVAVYALLYIYLPVTSAVVTKSDMDAMKWIDSTLGKNAVLSVNTCDAGAWIPAVTGRSIKYDDLPINRLSRTTAGYIYLGSRCAGSATITKEGLESYPGLYKRVYADKGGAQVWKILR